MAARTKRTKLDDTWRSRIQASMLVNRLTEHANAPIDQPVMSDSQIRAAQILLNKVAPDLKAVEMTGEDGGPIKTTIAVEFVDAAARK